MPTTPKFTAADAVKATIGAAVNTERLDTFEARVVEKIKAACKLGRRHINYPFPFDGMPLLRDGIGGITSEERDMLKARLVALGYDWKDHDEPDPGHPCSRLYSTLSW
jgi:hypothetical protein